MLEVEVHPEPAMDKNRDGHGPEGSGNRRLASESSPVEQGQDVATSTGTLDREEMSELSDISTENVATTRSPTDNTMMHGMTKKPTTSSSFSERVRNTLRNFFPFTMGTGTGEEASPNRLETCLPSRLHVASVSRNASLLGVLAPLSQNDLTRFQRFSQQYPSGIAFWPLHKLGLSLTGSW